MNTVLKAIIANSKTTGVGVVVVVAALVLFFGDRVGISAEVKDAAAVALIGILGGGLVLSRDADKTSEASGVKDAP